MSYVKWQHFRLGLNVLIIWSLIDMVWWIQFQAVEILFQEWWHQAKLTQSADDLMMYGARSSAGTILNLSVLNIFYASCGKG